MPSFSLGSKFIETLNGGYRWSLVPAIFFGLVPGPIQVLVGGPWSRCDILMLWSLVPIKIKAMVLVPGIMVPGPWDHLANGPWSRDPHSESQSSTASQSVRPYMIRRKSHRRSRGGPRSTSLSELAGWGRKIYY